MSAKLVRLAAIGDIADVTDRLDADPSLATAETSAEFFFDAIRHQFYAGDTPLHAAAAAFRRRVAHLLVQRGANVRARNRRGAEPLHYAADANHWDPDAQADTIAYLISAGADPDAMTNDGVAPIHRAVRTRSAAAVRALIEGGADPHRPNRSGSTPLRLAQLTTGASGSGSLRAREQQAAIITLLELAAS